MAAFVRVQDGHKVVVARLIKNAKYNIYQTTEVDTKDSRADPVHARRDKKNLEALKRQALKTLRTIAGGELVDIEKLRKLLPQIPGIARTWSCVKAFERAAFEGWREVSQLLLGVGCDPNGHPHTDAHTDLLCDEDDDEDEDEEEQDYSWHWREFTGSPLYLAAKAGNLLTVQLLLEAGARVDELLDGAAFAGPLGPLEAAAEGGHTLVVKALLAKGAGGGGNKQQLNAALRAASKADTVRALLQAKADPVDTDCFGVTAVHEAAFCGRPECLSLLLRSSNAKFQLIVRTDEGMTPLHAAVISGNRKCISLLIEAGAQVDAKDRLEATPLHYASWRLSGIGSIPMLLKGGASVNARDKFGKSPLHYAAEFDNEEMVRLLVNAGANIEALDKRNRRPRDMLRRNTLTADKQGFRDVIWLMLNPKGKPPPPPLPPASSAAAAPKEAKRRATVCNGRIAAERKRPPTAETRRLAIWEMRKLLCVSWRHREDERGEDAKCNLQKLKELLVKAPDAVHTYSCLKALQESAARGAHDALQVLLECGASPNARACDRWLEDCCPQRARCDCAARTNFDHNNWSLLHIAARAGHLKVVEVLLAHRASLEQIRVKDQDLPWGPLEAAAEYGDNCLPVVQALLRAGAGTDRVQLNSALWHACSPELGRSEGEVGNHKVATLLLNAGADPNACSWKVLGATSVHGVAYSRWPACLALLLRRGGNVLARKTDGTTPLHAAARVGNNTEMVTMLISAGADILARDGEAKTPLHHAAGRRGDLESVTALLLAGAEVDARDNTDSTPLHEATKCKYIHCSILSVLLAAGADVDARDAKQRTALHWAAQQDSLEGVECLLQAGADKGLKDCRGHRPHDMVCRERACNSHTEDIRRKTRHLLSVHSPTTRPRTATATTAALSSASTTTASNNTRSSNAAAAPVMPHWVMRRINRFNRRKMMKQSPSFNINRVKRRIIDVSNRNVKSNLSRRRSCSARNVAARASGPKMQRHSTHGLRRAVSRMIARKSSSFMACLDNGEGNTPQAMAVAALEKVGNGLYMSSSKLQSVLSKAPTVATWSACQRTLLKLAYEGHSKLLHVVLKAGGNPNFCREWETLLQITNGPPKKDPKGDKRDKEEHHPHPKPPPPSGDDDDGGGSTSESQTETPPAAAATKPKFDYFLPLLDIAASRGHLKTVQVLLGAGATVGPVDKRAFGMPLEPLVGAAEGGHSAVVSLLLKAGASANKEQLNASLRSAANVETVEALLLAGADPSAPDAFGSTSVHEAVYCRRAQCLAVLLNHGGSPSTETLMGRTPLHAAALAGSSTCISLLLENGADVNARDNINACALHWAAGRCTGPECVTPLLEGGADINARDKFGRTPLHYAVAFGRVAAVKALIDAGADQEARDLIGCIPRRMRRRKWDTAEWMSHQNALALLLRPSPPRPPDAATNNSSSSSKDVVKGDETEEASEKEHRKKVEKEGTAAAKKKNKKKTRTPTKKNEKERKKEEGKSKEEDGKKEGKEYERQVSKSSVNLKCKEQETKNEKRKEEKETERKVSRLSVNLKCKEQDMKNEKKKEGKESKRQVSKSMVNLKFKEQERSNEIKKEEKETERKVSRLSVNSKCKEQETKKEEKEAERKVSKSSVNTKCEEVETKDGKKTKEKKYKERVKTRHTREGKLFKKKMMLMKVGGLLRRPKSAGGRGGKGGGGLGMWPTTDAVRQIIRALTTPHCMLGGEDDDDEWEDTPMDEEDEDDEDEEEDEKEEEKEEEEEEEEEEKKDKGVGTQTKKKENPDMRAEALRELRKIACYQIPPGSRYEYEVPWSVEELEELIAEAPTVVRSFTCLRAMQRAAQEGYTDVLHLLLEAGASANASEYHASEDYYLSHDDLLDPNSSQDDAFFEDDYNLQPLVHIAAGAGNVEAVELLVSAGASLEQDVVLVKGPLEVAVEHVQAGCVEALLAAGAAVDRLQLNSALWLAVASNGPCELLAGCNRKSVRLLLDSGADPNATANPHTGFTALHGAAFSRCDECLPLLLRRGASVGARDAEGRTPLHIAASVGSVQCVALLCEAGADPGARDDEGRTALHAACGETGDPLVIEALLKGAAAPVNSSANGSWNPKGGADPNAADRSGATPLHLAARWDSTLAEVLLRARADPSRRDKYGNTPLHVAAQCNNRSVVDALVAKGGDPQAKNNKAQRPCDLAPHLFPATMKALIRASCRNFRSVALCRSSKFPSRRSSDKSSTTVTSSVPSTQQQPQQQQHQQQQRKVVHHVQQRKVMYAQRRKYRHRK